MATTNVKLYSLGYGDIRTYAAATAFAAGNIALPQLFHLVPLGGPAWLPIYFFTLIAAYKYGWKAGLLTALLSPLANHLLFGMPAQAVLPVIWVKSGLLALAAGYAARRFSTVSIPALVAVVLSYQAAGMLAEWALTGDFLSAAQNIRIALPGMLLQVFGGFLFIRYALRK